jgi:hypothetical protein
MADIVIEYQNTEYTVKVSPNSNAIKKQVQTLIEKYKTNTTTQKYSQLKNLIDIEFNKLIETITTSSKQIIEQDQQRISQLINVLTIVPLTLKYDKPKSEWDLQTLNAKAGSPEVALWMMYHTQNPVLSTDVVKELARIMYDTKQKSIINGTQVKKTNEIIFIQPDIKNIAKDVKLKDIYTIYKYYDLLVKSL